MACGNNASTSMNASMSESRSSSGNVSIIVSVLSMLCRGSPSITHVSCISKDTVWRMFSHTWFLHHKSFVYLFIPYEKPFLGQLVYWQIILHYLFFTVFLNNNLKFVVIFSGSSSIKSAGCHWDSHEWRWKMCFGYNATRWLIIGLVVWRQGCSSKVSLVKSWLLWKSQTW